MRIRTIILGLIALLVVGAPIALTAPAQAASDTKPTITKFTAPEDFYPTVRDGYRDGVTFHARARDLSNENGGSLRQDFSITVRNADGRKVAEREGSQRWGIWSDWNWNGKNLSGDPVSTGKYTATFTVTNPETGETDTATAKVYAKTDTVAKRVTKTRAPRDTTTRRTRGCSIHNGWSSGDLHLDCVGGRFAEVTYRFGIPADASNISWSLPWNSDGSLSIGSVSRKGERLSKTAYRITARVTRYRGMLVHNVVLSYKTRVRI